MAVIAGVVIAAIASYQIWHSYGAAVQAARRDIAQLVQTFAASSDATLQSLELILDQVAAEVHRATAEDARPGSLTDRFIAIADDWPFVTSVTFFTPDGISRDRVVRTGDGKLHIVPLLNSLSDRPFFQYHRDIDLAGTSIFLTDPIEANAERDIAVAMTKKIRDADGRFVGICSVTIKVDTLAQMFAGLLPARYANVSLFKRNGTLLVNLPQTANIGRSYKNRALFTRRLTAATSEVYRLKSATDGSERLMAFLASPRYPVVITVSALWDNALAAWTSGAMILGAASATGILLIIALTWWQLSRIRSEQAAQLALANSERNLIESQRLAGIGHFDRDLSTNVYTWSENMYAMHGVTPADYVPTRDALLPLVLPEDRARLLAFWGRAGDSSVSGVVEVRIQLPGGRLRNIQYGWRRLEGQMGGGARVFGIAQDMTPMRAAEATIREDEERLRDIVECSGDYIWESDAEGRVAMITGGGASPIGFLDDVHPRGLETTVEGGDAATLREAIRGRAKFRNLVVPAADSTGRLRWVRVSANPRFDAYGAFLGYRGAGTDVTDQRHQQERDEDRRKGEAIGRLAGGLAHEINNLLQPILIYAAFGAGTGASASDTRQYFGRIARAAEQATLIVRNVLTSARKSPPVRESVNVRDAIRETAEILGGTLPDGILLSVDCAVSDLFARVDRTGLVQVLTNLVTNAAEAIGDVAGNQSRRAGRIVVNASAVHLGDDAARNLSLAPGAYCRLSVADNGPGIPREHIDMVFEPFFTTKPQGKGTGLGLSVVLGLARSWRGTVAIEDSPDGDTLDRPALNCPTCFAVYLPLEDRQLQAAQ
jgi:PAS domain S-box-containing protein